MKSFNQSQHARAKRPQKPDFAMTGIIVGMVVGWIVGVTAEILLHRTMIVMVLGGFAGALLGSGFEAIRFGWKTHRFRAGKKY